MLGVAHDMSLMIINYDVENTGEKTDNLRVGVLNLIWLQILHREEEKKGDMDVNIIGGKEITNNDKISYFQNKVVIVTLYRSKC